MWHALMDFFLVKLSTLPMGAKKYFTRSISGPSWTRLFAESSALTPRPEVPGQFLLPMQSPAGPLDPAYRIVQWRGAAFPTLLFHPDYNEAPFDFSPKANNTFKNMFVWKQPPVEANLIVVRPPYHARDLGSYLEQVGELSHYMAMLAGSVLVFEHVIRECQEKKNERVYLCGAGLGGWAVNLHRTFFNHAQGYIPLLAGAALGEAFVSGLYRDWTGALPREYPASVRQLLDFEEAWGKVETANVFPLLARYDGMTVWERQKLAYAQAPLTTLAKGHMTALMAPELLRRHVLAAMGLA